VSAEGLPISNESSRQKIRHLITGRLDGLEFEALSPRYPASELFNGADRKIDGSQTGSTSLFPCTTPIAPGGKIVEIDAIPRRGVGKARLGRDR
jgi:hypothetical protein